MANYYRIESVPDGFVKLKINAIYRKDSDSKIIKFKISGGYGLAVTNAEEISEVNGAIATKHKGYTKWGRELSDLTIKRITKDAHYKTVQGPPAPLVGPVPYDKLSNADKDYHRNTANTSPKQGMNAGFVPLSEPTGESSYGTTSRSIKNTQETKSKPRQQSTPKEEVEVIPSDWSKFNKKEIFELFSCAWGWYNRPMSKMKSSFHGVDQDSTFDVINPFIIYGIMKKRVKAENLPAYNILIKLPGIIGNAELQNYYNRMFNKKTSDDADAQKAANRYDSRNMKIGGMNFNIGKLPTSLRHTINAGRLTSRALFGTARGIIATSKWLGTSKLPWPKQGKGEQEGSKAEQATANQQAATPSPASSNAKESKDDKVNTVRFDKLSKILTAIKDSLKPKDKEAKNVEGVDKADLSDTTKHSATTSTDGKVEKEAGKGIFGALGGLFSMLMGALKVGFSLVGTIFKSVMSGFVSMLSSGMGIFGTVIRTLISSLAFLGPLLLPIAGILAGGLLVKFLGDKVSEWIGNSDAAQSEREAQQERHVGEIAPTKALKDMNSEEFSALNAKRKEDGKTEFTAQQKDDYIANKDYQLEARDAEVARRKEVKDNNKGVVPITQALYDKIPAKLKAEWQKDGKTFRITDALGTEGSPDIAQSSAIKSVVASAQRSTEIVKTAAAIQEEKDKSVKHEVERQIPNASPPAPIIVPSGGSGGFQNSSRMDNDSIMYEYLFKTARPSFVC